MPTTLIDPRALPTFAPPHVDPGQDLLDWMDAQRKKAPDVYTKEGVEQWSKLTDNQRKHFIAKDTQEKDADLVGWLDQQHQERAKTQGVPLEKYWQNRQQTFKDYQVKQVENEKKGKEIANNLPLSGGLPRDIEDVPQELYPYVAKAFSERLQNTPDNTTFKERLQARFMDPLNLEDLFGPHFEATTPEKTKFLHHLKGLSSELRPNNPYDFYDPRGVTISALKIAPDLADPYQFGIKAGGESYESTLDSGGSHKNALATGLFAGAATQLLMSPAMSRLFGPVAETAGWKAAVAGYGEHVAQASALSGGALTSQELIKGFGSWAAGNAPPDVADAVTKGVKGAIQAAPMMAVLGVPRLAAHTPAEPASPFRKNVFDESGKPDPEAVKYWTENEPEKMRALGEYKDASRGAWQEAGLPGKPEKPNRKAFMEEVKAALKAVAPTLADIQKPFGVSSEMLADYSDSKPLGTIVQQSPDTRYVLANNGKNKRGRREIIWDAETLENGKWVPLIGLNQQLRIYEGVDGTLRVQGDAGFHTDSYTDSSGQHHVVPGKEILPPQPPETAPDVKPPETPQAPVPVAQKEEVPNAPPPEVSRPAEAPPAGQVGPEDTQGVEVKPSKGVASPGDTGQQPPEGEPTAPVAGPKTPLPSREATKARGQLQTALKDIPLGKYGEARAELNKAIDEGRPEAVNEIIDRYKKEAAAPVSAAPGEEQQYMNDVRQRIYKLPFKHQQAAQREISDAVGNGIDDEAKDAVDQVLAKYAEGAPPLKRKTKSGSHFDAAQREMRTIINSDMPPKEKADAIAMARERVQLAGALDQGKKFTDDELRDSNYDLENTHRLYDAEGAPPLPIKEVEPEKPATPSQIGKQNAAAKAQEREYQPGDPLPEGTAFAGAPGLGNFINDVRERISNLVRTRGAKATLSKEHDVSENLPRIEARKLRNDVQEEYTHVMGKKLTNLDRNALPFLVEAGGARARLEGFARMLAPLDRTKPWIESAQNAVKHALDNFNRLEPLRAKVQGILDNQVYEEQSKGFDIEHRQAYFPHDQEVAEDLPLPFAHKPSGAGTPFKHERVYDSFAESIAAGIKPRTLNGLDLMEARLRKGMRMITRQEWAEIGRSIKDPTTGKPLITDPIVKTRQMPDGSTKVSDVVPPPGYAMKVIGGRAPVAVYEPYAGIYDALTGQSAVRNSSVGRALIEGVGALKHGLLLFDSFHLARIAFYRAALHPIKTVTGEASYRKGALLLDNNNETLQRMAGRGEIDPAMLPGLLANRANLDLMVKAGLNVGGIADNIAPHWLRQLPVIGDYNRFLFETFQRGGMTQSALIEFDRVKASKPNLSDDQVARQVAKDLNTRFGNLNAQGWLKSKTMQDMARLVFLAPQWNEGLLRSEFGAVKGAAVETLPKALQGQIVANTLVKGAAIGILGYFAANQIINMVTRHKPTWENEEEGLSSKISAYIPDFIGNGPGVFLNPFALFGEITHQVISALDRQQTLAQAASHTIGNKLGPIPKSLTAMIQEAIKSRSTWEGIKAGGIGLLPVPIPAKPVASLVKSLSGGKVTEDYPGEMERQLFSSGGLRADPAPSSEQRIYDLVDRFKSAHESKTGVKIKPRPEFVGSDYNELVRALRQDDDERAKTALQELAKTKEAKTIIHYFKTWPTHPFTGSTQLEKEFKGTLTAEQMSQYRAAKESRVSVAGRFFSKFGPLLNQFYKGEVK